MQGKCSKKKHMLGNKLAFYFSRIFSHRHTNILLEIEVQN